MQGYALVLFIGIISSKEKNKTPSVSFEGEEFSFERISNGIKNVKCYRQINLKNIAEKRTHPAESPWVLLQDGDCL